MKPWGTLRRELLGVWRSVRYDLDRRAETRDEDWSSERERLSTLLRDPRRVGAAVGVASIIVASATGTYFAVVGGLGILIADAAGVPVLPQAAPFGSFAPLAPLVPPRTRRRLRHRSTRTTRRPTGPGRRRHSRCRCRRSWRSTTPNRSRPARR